MRSKGGSPFGEVVVEVVAVLQDDPKSVAGQRVLEPKSDDVFEHLVHVDEEGIAASEAGHLFEVAVVVGQLMACLRDADLGKG